MESMQVFGQHTGRVLGFVLQPPWRASSVGGRLAIRFVSYSLLLVGPAFLFYLNNFAIQHPAVMQTTVCFWVSMLASVVLVWFGAFVYQCGIDAKDVPLQGIHFLAVFALFFNVVMRLWP